MMLKTVTPLGSTNDSITEENYVHIPDTFMQEATQVIVSSDLPAETTATIVSGDIDLAGVDEEFFEDINEVDHEEVHDEEQVALP